MKRILVAALVAGTALAACSQEADPAEELANDTDVTEVRSASAELMDTEGNMVGTALVTESEDNSGLLVHVAVDNLPPGLHGFHIHTTGDCSAADFTSAGGHWNPDNTNHGINSEAPNPHAGDLPNLLIEDSGAGAIDAASNGTFDGLMDEDGSAIVIHAGEDDYVSQPSGDAGARIACGVLTAS